MLSTVPRMQRLERSRHGVTVLLGAWLVLGVFIDGWAHFNRPGLETFFTPWHGLLYSGAAALFGWLLLPAFNTGDRDRRWAVTAAAIFTAGGLGDLIWHEILGVEAGLDALVSPTHLLLLTGGILGLTAPLRDGRGPHSKDRGGAWPAVGSVTLATALSAFFLLYASPFTSGAPTLALTTIPEGSPGHQQAEVPAAAGLAAYLVATAVVVVPLLVLHTRRALPFGSITLLVTSIATLSTAVTQFQQPAAPVAALLAGFSADLVLRASRLAQQVALQLIGAGVPLLLWTAQLSALAVTADIEWPPELVAGVVVLSSLFGGALALLTRPASHERAYRDTTAAA